MPVRKSVLERARQLELVLVLVTLLVPERDPVAELESAWDPMPVLELDPVTEREPEPQ